MTAGLRCGSSRLSRTPSRRLPRHRVRGEGVAPCVRKRRDGGSRRWSGPEAVPADDGEAREDAVALIRGADAGEIDQSPVASVAPDEREEPAALQDAIAVEVGPVGPLAPAALTADAEIEVGRYADEPELARIEPQAFLEHAPTLKEQGVLDVGAREAPTAGQAECFEELRDRLLALREALDEARLRIDGERHVAQSR